MDQGSWLASHPGHTKSITYFSDRLATNIDPDGRNKTSVVQDMYGASLSLSSRL